MFWHFAHKAWEILAPRPGMEPTPPALEGKVLNIGPPEKPQAGVPEFCEQFYQIKWTQDGGHGKIWFSAKLQSDQSPLEA